MIARLQSNHAPFLTRMHCFAHHTILCVEKLDDMQIIKKIEVLSLHLFLYFVHNNKWQIEFRRLVANLETEGNKIGKNVKTRWIYIVVGANANCTSRVKTLVVQMSADTSNVAAAKSSASL